MISSICCSEFIHDVFNVLCPLQGRLRLVEGLPGDGLPDGDGESLVAVLQHLVGQVEHGDVELDAEGLADVGQVVEEVGVPAVEVDGYHVALVLHALDDESLLPLQVADDAPLAPRAQPGRKHEQLIVRGESGLNHAGKVLGLASGLVDGDAEGREAVQVHQQVVDQVLDLAVVARAQHVAQGQTVLPAQGMIGNEGAEAAVGGQILFATHHELRIQEVQAGFQEVYPDLILRATQEAVQLILMDDTLEVGDDKLRDILRLLRSFLPQHLVYVYQKQRIVSHARCYNFTAQN